VGTLDLVSRWLVSTRSAVLVTTLISCLLAGLYALREGTFRPLAWLALTVGLCSPTHEQPLQRLHRLLPRRGQDNYFRTMYGPQPVATGS